MESFLIRAMEIEREYKRIFERLSGEVEESSAASIFQHLAAHKENCLRTLREVLSLLGRELGVGFRGPGPEGPPRARREGNDIQTLYHTVRGYTRTMEGLLRGYSHLAYSISNVRASDKLILIVAREVRELEALRRMMAVFEDMFGDSLGLLGW